MIKKIKIFHSPDADDAFMFYGFVSGKVRRPGYEFEHDLCDIQSLNDRAQSGDLDVTAVSVHAYPYLSSKYAVLTCGASMGEKDYGPRLVSRTELSLKDGKKHRVALPGTLTSAALAFRMFAIEENLNVEYQYMHFDRIQDAVRSGEVDAGVIIHEGQITLEREGFLMPLDLGAWWWQKTKLPLPLGVNIVNRDLGSEVMTVVRDVLRESIECALENRKEALDYALSYGRGLSVEDADKFVAMYVNRRRTLDLGEEGRRSIQLFLDRGAELGIIPNRVVVDFI